MAISSIRSGGHDLVGGKHRLELAEDPASGLFLEDRASSWGRDSRG